MLSSECVDIQRNEIQALSSIFLQDFVVEQNTTKRVWNKNVLPAFSINVQVDEVSSSPLLTRETLPTVTLRVEYTAMYPKTSPNLKLVNPRNLTDFDIANLSSAMRACLQTHLGTEMIYDLIDILRNELQSCVRTTSATSLNQERVLRLQEVEAEKSEKAQIVIERESRERSLQQQRLRDQIRADLNAKTNAKEVAHDKIDTQVLELADAEMLVFNRPLKIGDFLIAKIPLHRPVVLNDKSTTRPWISYLSVAGTIVVKEYALDHASQSTLQVAETMIAKIVKIAQRHRVDVGVQTLGSTIAASANGYRFFVVQRFCPKGSLSDLLGIISTIDLALAKSWLINLASELVIGHRMGFVHGRICSSKVLLVEQDNRVVATLCDWSYSSFLHRHANLDSQSRNESEYNPTIRPSDDVVSICQLFLKMIVGCKMNVVGSLEDLFREHQSQIPDEVRVFLSGVLHNVKHQRLTASDLLLTEFCRSVYAGSAEVSLGASRQTTSIATLSRYLIDFEELSDIGRGAYGTVVKARNRLDGRVYAVKRIETKAETRVLREVAGLARLNHPSIVRYFASWVEQGIRNVSETSINSSGDSDFQDLTTSEDFMSFSDKRFADSESRNDMQGSLSGQFSPEPDTERLAARTLFIQMEYCSGDTLRNLIDGNMVGSSLWNYFSQIVDGVKYIHSVGLIHRDLKPANIFVSPEGSLKLGDFGLAIEVTAVTIDNENNMPTGKTDHENTGQVGTYIYQAPELLNCTSYDSKIDLYALGIILGELSCKWSTGMERILLLQGLRLPDIVCPLPTERQREISLLRALLSHNPAERPSAESLASMLPPVVHKTYLEDTLKLLSGNQTFKQDILSHLFEDQPQSAEYVYDAEHHSHARADVALARESLFQNIQHIFRGHSGIDRSGSIPALLPYNKLYQEKQNVVKVMDELSNVLQLPYDFKVPFARQLARQHSDISYGRSFVIGPVYRTDGRNSRTLFEADFDIVSDVVSTAHRVETIRILFEIIRSVPQVDLEMTYYTLGHSNIARAILEEARVPEQQLNTVLAILSTLSHKADRYNEHTWHKTLASILSESTILQILKFVPQPSRDFGVELRRILALLSVTRQERLVGVCASLYDFVKVAERYAVTIPVRFQPFPPATYFFELTYTLEYGKNLGDIVAVGGTYDTLIRSLAIPGTTPQDLSACGFSLALDKLPKLSPYVMPDRVPVRQVDIVINALAHESQAITLITRLWDSAISAELCFAGECIKFCAERRAAILLSFKEKRTPISVQQMIRVKKLDKDETDEVSLDAITNYLLSELASSPMIPKVPKLVRTASNIRPPDMIIISADDSKRLRANQRNVALHRAQEQFQELSKQFHEGVIPIVIIDFAAEDMVTLRFYTTKAADEHALRRISENLSDNLARHSLAILRQAIDKLRAEDKRNLYICSSKCVDFILLNIS